MRGQLTQRAPGTWTVVLFVGCDPVTGKRLARQSHVRFALVDPQCTYQTGDAYGPPKIGRLVFASTRLLVLELND